MAAHCAPCSTSHTTGEASIGLPGASHHARSFTGSCSAARCCGGRLRGVQSGGAGVRSEEHTSELQSLMRISYAVFCLKKKYALHSIIRSYYDATCYT